MTASDLNLQPLACKAKYMKAYILFILYNTMIPTQLHFIIPIAKGYGIKSNAALLNQYKLKQLNKVYSGKNLDGTEQ